MRTDGGQDLHARSEGNWPLHGSPCTTSTASRFQGTRTWQGNDRKHPTSYEITARTGKLLGQREGNSGAPLNEPPSRGEDDDAVPFWARPTNSTQLNAQRARPAASHREKLGLWVIQGLSVSPAVEVSIQANCALQWYGCSAPRLGISPIMPSLEKDVRDKLNSPIFVFEEKL